MKKKEKQKENKKIRDRLMLLSFIVTIYIVTDYSAE